MQKEIGHLCYCYIKVSVDPYITVEEGHRIGKHVKEKLMKQDNVQNVLYILIRILQIKHNGYLII